MRGGTLVPRRMKIPEVRRWQDRLWWWGSSSAWRRRAPPPCKPSPLTWWIERKMRTEMRTRTGTVSMPSMMKTQVVRMAMYGDKNEGRGRGWLTWCPQRWRRRWWGWRCQAPWGSGSSARPTHPDWSPPCSTLSLFVLSTAVLPFPHVWSPIWLCSQ